MASKRSQENSRTSDNGRRFQKFFQQVNSSQNMYKLIAFNVLKHSLAQAIFLASLLESLGTGIKMAHEFLQTSLSTTPLLRSLQHDLEVQQVPEQCMKCELQLVLLL